MPGKKLMQVLFRRNAERKYQEQQARSQMPYDRVFMQPIF